MSHETPDRRQFLRLGAGAGLIFGLGALGRFGWADEGKGGGDPARALAEAKARMKTLRRNGVAVVVPTDPAKREALGKALQKLVPVISLHQNAPAEARYLLSNVWVCVRAEDVGAKPGETLVLLDPSGKRIAGTSLDLGGPREKVLKGLAALTEGEGRLAAQRKRLRQDPAQAKLLEALASGKGDAFQQALNQLHQRGLHLVTPELFPLLDELSQDEFQGRIQQSLRYLYFERIKQARGFPYGATFKVEAHEPEPCPPCGMAAPSVSGRTFLEFFSKGRR